MSENLHSHPTRSGAPPLEQSETAALVRVRIARPSAGWRILAEPLSPNVSVTECDGAIFASAPHGERASVLLLPWPASLDAGETSDARLDTLLARADSLAVADLRSGRSTLRPSTPAERAFAAASSDPRIAAVARAFARLAAGSVPGRARDLADALAAPKSGSIPGEDLVRDEAGAIYASLGVVVRDMATLDARIVSVAGEDDLLLLALPTKPGAPGTFACYGPLGTAIRLGSPEFEAVEIAVEVDGAVRGVSERERQTLRNPRLGPAAVRTCGVVEPLAGPTVSPEQVKAEFAAAVQVARPGVERLFWSGIEDAQGATLAGAEEDLECAKKAAFVADGQVKTMGISLKDASAPVRVNPDWFLSLTPEDRIRAMHDAVRAVRAGRAYATNVESTPDSAPEMVAVPGGDDPGAPTLVAEEVDVGVVGNRGADLANATVAHAPESPEGPAEPPIPAEGEVDTAEFEEGRPGRFADDELWPDDAAAPEPTDDVVLDDFDIPDGRAPRAVGASAGEPVAEMDPGFAQAAQRSTGEGKGRTKERIPDPAYSGTVTKKTVDIKELGGRAWQNDERRGQLTLAALIRVAVDHPAELLDTATFGNALALSGAVELGLPLAAEPSAVAAALRGVDRRLNDPSGPLPVTALTFGTPEGPRVFYVRPRREGGLRVVDFRGGEVDEARVLRSIADAMAMPYGEAFPDGPNEDFRRARTAASRRRFSSHTGGPGPGMGGGGGHRRGGGPRH